MWRRRWVGLARWGGAVRCGAVGEKGGGGGGWWGPCAGRGQRYRLHLRVGRQCAVGAVRGGEGAATGGVGGRWACPGALGGEHEECSVFFCASVVFF